MTSPSTKDPRFCPACGRDASGETCAWDGTPTVVRAIVGQEGLKFAPASVVAGRYRIEVLLGRGGFGAVYSARHVSTGQQVALKFLALDGEDQGDAAIRRFFQEAKITAQLRHPNTVRLYDFGQAENGALFMAMEMLVGPSLERVLREAELFGKVLGEQKACEIGISALRSLSEAHASDLVHRDLKPANMVLAEVPGEDRVVKLLDFGIARIRGSSLTGSGTALGTPAYMSPEQCVGQDVDGRSDLYSLAVVLFRCATGQLPFEGNDPLQLMYRHRYEAAPDPREVAPGEVSEALAEVLAKSLAKAPDDRFADARSMRTALERVAAARHPGTDAVIDLDNELLHAWASSGGVPDVQAGTPPPLPMPGEVAAAKAASSPRAAVRPPSAPASMTPLTGKATPVPPGFDVGKPAAPRPPSGPAALPRAPSAPAAAPRPSSAPAALPRAPSAPAAAPVSPSSPSSRPPSAPRVLELPDPRHRPTDELPETPPTRPLKLIAAGASAVAVAAVAWIAISAGSKSEPAATPQTVAGGTQAGAGADTETGTETGTGTGTVTGTGTGTGSGTDAVVAQPPPKPAEPPPPAVAVAPPPAAVSPTVAAPVPAVAAELPAAPPAVVAPPTETRPKPVKAEAAASKPAVARPPSAPKPPKPKKSSTVVDD